ncbi:hypothetical protein COS75_00335 [Candidatus Pacearchaeota archaeon CG06_land_8_20_14_3_00_35_12]|nr:MAG: hypothetical protein COS75_00335 [Candidatus Pacearchaeota archaeon CG06_land_8_20_14_3_00_35_12]
MEIDGLTSEEYLEAVLYHYKKRNITNVLPVNDEELKTAVYRTFRQFPEIIKNYWFKCNCDDEKSDRLDYLLEGIDFAISSIESDGKISSSSNNSNYFLNSEINIDYAWTIAPRLEETEINRIAEAAKIFAAQINIIKSEQNKQ